MQIFVFTDMDDYNSRGKNVDAEHAKMVADKKNRKSKILWQDTLVVQKAEPKPVEIPLDIVGKKVQHKAFGNGTITDIVGSSIEVTFDNVGLKKMGYEFCMEKNMLEFI